MVTKHVISPSKPRLVAVIFFSEMVRAQIGKFPKMLDLIFVKHSNRPIRYNGSVE